MKNHFRLSFAFASGPLCARTPLLHAREARWTLPAGRLAFLIPDQGGWHGRVAAEVKPVLADSRLGREFKDVTGSGLAAIITKTTRHNGTREKHFSKRSVVRDHWKERRLTLLEQERTSGLVVRLRRGDDVPLRFAGGFQAWQFRADERAGARFVKSETEVT